MTLGLSKALIATIILIISYTVLFTERLNRAVTVMLGAGAMIVFGVLSYKEAIKGIDFNTITLLIGMMIIVGITEKSGAFQFIAIKAAKLVKASPRGLLAMLGIITAVLSAFLDNVTTVLLIVPITIEITRKLNINAYPYLLMEIFSSNIGGTATLIGDPPNIIIGSALHLRFTDFLFELTPIVIVSLSILLLTFDIAYGRTLKADDLSKKDIMSVNEYDCITNPKLLIKSISVLTITILGFIFAEQINIENGTIALFGAAILLALYTLKEPHRERDSLTEDAFSLVDWTTIFFFTGLFAIVYGLEVSGVLEYLGKEALTLVDGSIKKATYLVLWSSALLSTIVDNIPFVATMIPLLKTMEASLGSREVMMPVWWALSLGSCFGGNGSLIAASANVIVAGIAAREGRPINFIKFLLWSIPVMLTSIVIVSAYFYVKFFI